MRQMIVTVGIFLMVLPAVEWMRPAAAEMQNSAQKTATCTLQVTGMT
jgi:hypothetical protein